MNLTNHLDGEVGVKGKKKGKLRGIIVKWKRRSRNVQKIQMGGSEPKQRGSEGPRRAYRG